MSNKNKLIVFYLPQFHPIPENDKWWGKGFTEWTNVTKAKPLFRGHYQPHLPADLGYYDLRVPEVRQAQADLAKEYGIHGFCYYHYWFSGKRLLERPFQEVLESGKPDFPFCLCWANENWTRNWDGQANQILLKQEYSHMDDLNHIRSLLPAFSDHRYIKVEGKPLFLVYRVSNLPNPQKTTDIWREEFLRQGLGELYLCKVESIFKDEGDPKQLGFDAAVDFQPDWDLFDYRKFKGRFWGLLIRLGIINKAYRKNTVLDYQTLVNVSLQKPEPDYLRFPCVTPSWDNSSRKKEKCQIIINSSPDQYEYWLSTIIKLNNSKEFIFLNAWNEWAEGNHLEPDQKFGKSYLEATLNALKNK